MYTENVNEVGIVSFTAKYGFERDNKLQRIHCKKMLIFKLNNIIYAKREGIAHEF